MQTGPLHEPGKMNGVGAQLASRGDNGHWGNITHGRCLVRPAHLQGGNLVIQKRDRQRKIVGGYDPVGRERTDLESGAEGEELTGEGPALVLNKDRKCKCHLLNPCPGILSQLLMLLEPKWQRAVGYMENCLGRPSADGRTTWKRDERLPGGESAPQSFLLKAFRACVGYKHRPSSGGGSIMNKTAINNNKTLFLLTDVRDKFPFPRNGSPVFILEAWVAVGVRGGCEVSPAPSQPTLGTLKTLSPPGSWAQVGTDGIAEVSRKAAAQREAWPSPPGGTLAKMRGFCWNSSSLLLLEGFDWGMELRELQAASKGPPVPREQHSPNSCGKADGGHFEITLPWVTGFWEPERISIKSGHFWKPFH